jgi:hypothetical protein
MSRRAASIAAFASLAFAPAVAAAQSAPSPVTLPAPAAPPASAAPVPAPPAPPVPPGLVPVFPPGVVPSSGPQPTPARRPASTGPLPYYPPPPYAYYPPPATYYDTAGMGLAPPTTLPFEDGQTVPYGYTLETRRVHSMIIAGAVTFSSTYVTSIIAAMSVLSGGSSNGSQLDPLFVPVFGPFITIGTAQARGAATVWLALDGLAQTGGLTMFVYGLVAREKYLQRKSHEASGALDVLARPEVVVGARAAGLRWAF